MQVGLEIAIVIAVQVGTTTALGMLLKMVIKQLNKQNGAIADGQKWQQHHIETCHSNMRR